MAEPPTTGRRTRRSVPVPAEDENSTPAKRTRDQANATMELTNEECLALYNTFKNPDDFLNSFEKSACEKFIRGALKANKGPLPCMTCGKEVTTALGMVLHLNARKCKAKTPPISEEMAEITKEEEPVAHERKSKRLAVKQEEPEDEAYGQQPSLADKPKRARPPPKPKVVEVKSVQQLQEEPSLWIAMSQQDKTNFLTNFYGQGPYPCFAIKTEDNPNCNSFTSIDAAIEHNNACIQPMYFTFKGSRLEMLRNLPKPQRARYIREALAWKPSVSCLECNRIFTHIYGLIYHIERCKVDSEKAPWKCYRCGFTTTVQKGQDHLAKCRDGADGEYLPEDKLRLRMDDERPKIFGALDDVNLRSGKAIDKKENITKIDAQAAVEKLVNMGLDIRMKRKATMKASVSAGVLPPESTRVRINASNGSMRFRFRKAEITNAPTDLSGWDMYKTQMEQSVSLWEFEKRAAKVCDALIVKDNTVWASKNSTPSVDMDKKAVGFRFRSDPLAFCETSTKPDDLMFLRSFETYNAEPTQGSWLSMGYCGGPIHTTRFAPNPLSETEEVLLVCTFPNDASLVKGDFRGSAGAAQMWIVKHNPDSTCTLHPWFIIESKYGVVLTACWLAMPRAENDETLIGYVALGTTQGVVLIYRIDTNCTPIAGDRPTSVTPDPMIVLRQMERVKTEEGEVFPPPITRVEWSTFEESQYIAGVNAAGSVVIWDLRGNPATPKFLRENRWTSPASDICFAKDCELVVGFREKLVRVYNIHTWQMMLEENTIRTAGCRVISSPRGLSGFFTFQSEYFASGEVPATGIAYVCSDAAANGYFVVPLANRHDLQMWDASVSSINGITATCGVDGQLLLSANGRVAPRLSKADCAFSVMRPSLLLARRRCLEVPPEANKTKDCLFDHDSMNQKTWLDITVDPNKNSQKIEYSALELRNESLNAVATNSFIRPVVATGGQAGLLFLRPCAIDENTTLDPLDLVAQMITPKSLPKKKRGRPRKPKDEDDDDY